MSKFTDIEKNLYSQEKSAVITTEPEEYDKFVDSVARSYHRDRQKEWEKAYRENYKSKFGKNKDRSSLNLGVK